MVPFAALLLSLPSDLAQARPQAMAIGGGIDPTRSTCFHLDNLNAVGSTFGRGWDVTILSDQGPESAAPNRRACERDPDGNVARSELRDDLGRPRLELAPSTPPPTGPATRAEIRRRLLERVRLLAPGEPLLLYFTDHGSSGGARGSEVIHLWGEETLSVQELRSLLRAVPAGHPVVQVHDQCFGAGMLESIWEGDDAGSAPRPLSCGFSAAGVMELAYTGGGMMRAISSAARGNDPALRSFDGARELLSANPAHHSSPVASSDLLLERYLARTEAPPFARDADCGPETDPLPSRAPGLIAANDAVALQLRLDQLQKELGRQDPALTADTVDARIREADERMRAALADLSWASTRLKGAVFDWLRARPDTRGMAEGLEASYSHLDRLRREPGPAGTEALRKASDDYAARRAEYLRWESAALNGNGEFRAFLDAQGGKYFPPAETGPVAQRYGLWSGYSGTDILLAARTAASEATSRTSGLRRWKSAATSRRALALLQARSDPDSRRTLRQYLGMRACERSLFAAGGGSAAQP